MRRDLTEKAQVRKRRRRKRRHLPELEKTRMEF